MSPGVLADPPHQQRASLCFHVCAKGDLTPQPRRSGARSDVLLPTYNYHFFSYSPLSGVSAGFSRKRMPHLASICLSPYVGRILRLTSLAPDIVEAILNSNEPQGLSPAV